MVMNRHPKMRALLNNADPLVATIRNPDMSAEEVGNIVKVLKGGWVTPEDLVECVRRDVEETGNRIVDRSKEYPFFIHVHVGRSDSADLDGKDDGRFAIAIFSDHAFSDGFSGFVVLNDLITNVTLLVKHHDSTDPSKKSELASKIAEQSAELPLRPSIYEKTRAARSSIFRGIVDKAMVLLATHLIKSESSGYSPVLPIRQDQKDVDKWPLPVNPSYVLFRTGTKENLEAALQKCRSEGVTLHGAICTSIMMAFAKAKHPNLSEIPSQKFKLNLETDYNMRQRVKSPFPEPTVGFNILVSTMESFASDGMDMSTKFWDAARMSKRFTDEGRKGFMSLVPSIFAHYKLSPTVEKWEMPAKQGVFSDVNLSNLGRYPFATTHDLGEGRGELAIDGIHLYNSAPNLSYGGIIFLTRTAQIDYTMMTKFKEEDGNRVFDFIVKTIESIGTIEKDESVFEACNRILGE
ncbi:hypothetical protein HDU97_004486 [Phlyctochytrium planicorne]|nr:hypothetical protein HDU97_004486 [Phlyctochytrium planicorne]